MAILNHGRWVEALYVSLLDGQPDYRVTVDGVHAGTLTRSAEPGKWRYRAQSAEGEAHGYTSSPDAALEAIGEHWHHAESMFV